jgi:hypothetical protein
MDNEETAVETSSLLIQSMEFQKLLIHLLNDIDMNKNRMNDD